MDSGITRSAGAGPLWPGVCLLLAAIAPAAAGQETERPTPAPQPAVALPATVLPVVPPAASPEEAATNTAETAAPRNVVVAPPAPLVPLHSKAAIIRVLDKVTAETMAFEAPVGARVRYKSLIFEVKTCVTRRPGESQPQPSAYLTVTSDAGAASGVAFAARQIFKGWMFANAPGLNAIRHPVYDAWLVSCGGGSSG